VTSETKPRLGQRAYARWRTERFAPTSHQAVRKAIESGRIAAAVEGGLIDADLADSLWDANTNPAQQRQRLEKLRPDKQKKLFAGGDQGPRDRGDEGAAARAAEPALDYRRANSLREVFRAKITALQYRRMNGELVEAATVKRVQFELARRLRDRVNALVERAVPDLVGAPNAERVRAVLKREVRVALEELAGGLGG
jgi:hypothetical protein